MFHIEGGLVVTVAACVLYRELRAPMARVWSSFFSARPCHDGIFLREEVGACVYNSAHTYVAPFLLWLIVYFAKQPSLLPLCLIWIAHIAFDRLLGYGLKYDTDFKATHLHRV